MTGRIQVVIDGHKYEKATCDGKIFWISFTSGRIFDDNYVKTVMKSEPDGI